ncbi:hypothetical protein [Archaeoglobus neptunius]|uniref:hypothetical protein n=1 Tax=Archaeoglobus neptunius TaxID=2798580 RepID=UPI0019287DCA|nr:hypothetical protein [Archaeoglobus neptunius]
MAGWKRFVSLLVLVMLGSAASAVAWGGPTHYSIVKKFDVKISKNKLSKLYVEKLREKTDLKNNLMIKCPAFDCY